MFMKKSTYEVELLKAFQNGRKSRDFFKDDKEAMEQFATKSNLSIKSLPLLPEYINTKDI